MSPRRVARGAAGLLAVTALLCGCSSSTPDQGTFSASASTPATVSSVASAPASSTGPPAEPSGSASSRARVRTRSGLTVPDPAVTPGGTLSGVGRAQVCLKDWNARHKIISYAVQNEVSSRYGVIAGPGTTLHLDQLVPASLGGDATVRNVWPQPQAQEKKKNALESHLHQLVCQGHLSLSTAQQAIRDWPAALRTYPPS